MIKNQNESARKLKKKHFSLTLGKFSTQRSHISQLSRGSSRSKLGTPSYKQETLEKLGIDIEKYDKGVTGIKRDNVRDSKLKRKIPLSSESKGGHFLKGF